MAVSCAARLTLLLVKYHEQKWSGRLCMEGNSCTPVVNPAVCMGEAADPVSAKSPRSSTASLSGQSCQNKDAVLDRGDLAPTEFAASPRQTAALSEGAMQNLSSGHWQSSSDAPPAVTLKGECPGIGC